MLKQTIITKLTKEFAPIFLDVRDQSDAHAGHYPAAAGGETHFKITLVTPKFEALSPLERHQWVYRILTEEMSQIHALSLELKPAL